MSDLIVVEQADGIATVTINRPKMRNALSLAMWTAMGEVTQRLAAADSVRAIVYRGAGAQAFADLITSSLLRAGIAAACAAGAGLAAGGSGVAAARRPIRPDNSSRLV